MSIKNIEVFTLCFNTFSVTKRAIEILHEKADAPFKHTFVLCHYPENGLDEKLTHLFLETEKQKSKYCEEVRILRLDRNYGIHGNYEKVYNHLGLQDDTLYLAFDPDSRPLGSGFMTNALKVLEDETVGILVLPPLTHDVQRGEEEFKNTVRVRRIVRPGSWPTIMLTGKFIRSIGGVSQKHPQYGYIENVLLERAELYGFRGYFLEDTPDPHLSHEEFLKTDPLYAEWKMQCASFLTRLDFESWRKERVKLK